MTYLKKQTINDILMKTKLFLSALFAFIVAVGCSNDVRVVWTEGETDPETGRAVHTITVVNARKEQTGISGLLPIISIFRKREARFLCITDAGIS